MTYTRYSELNEVGKKKYSASDTSLSHSNKINIYILEVNTLRVLYVLKIDSEVAPLKIVHIKKERAWSWMDRE